MYPFLKFTITLARAKFRSPLSLDDESILKLRAGVTDIDMFLELNNARYFTYMELGRWDFSYRVGFVSLMKERKWGVVVGGASVRFRRRIPFLSKFDLTTKLICHDGRWFYLLQETHRDGKICSSALLKMGVTSKAGLIPAPDVTKALDKEDWNPNFPEWVNAWIDAEGQRPWPKD